MHFGIQANTLGFYAFWAFASLCCGTVDQVLSAAWHSGSSGHSAHWGPRAMHSERPWWMT
jgi:hypothetical protein